MNIFTIQCVHVVPAHVLASVYTCTCTCSSVGLERQTLSLRERQNVLSKS